MSEVMDYMERVIRTYNYRESQGVIMLRSGPAIPIDSFFDYFFDSWCIFNSPNPPKEINKIIYNEGVGVDLTEVVAMVRTTGGYDDREIRKAKKS